MRHPDPDQAHPVDPQNWVAIMAALSWANRQFIRADDVADASQRLGLQLRLFALDDGFRRRLRAWSRGEAA